MIELIIALFFLFVCPNDAPPVPVDDTEEPEYIGDGDWSGNEKGKPEESNG